MLKLYNTFTKSLETLESNGSDIKIYLCGPTVQSSPHIGHGRSAVVFDFMVRYIKFSGNSVIFARNITDIDDKIIDKVNSGAIGYKELTAKFNDMFLQHSLSLNIQEANQYPKTSDHVEAMIGFIKALIDKEYAYNVDGNIFFDTEKYSDEDTQSYKKYPTEDKWINGFLSFGSDEL